MKRFSTDSKINSFVYQLLGNGWQVENRKKHAILIAPNRRKIAIPSTPSDCKAFYSFVRQTKHLVKNTH